MPRDPWKNQPNYKIGGGQLNEYEFNQQHGALSEQEKRPFEFQEQERELSGENESSAGKSGATDEAGRVRRLMEEAHEKVERRQGARATSGAKKSGGTKKSAGAKKSATQATKKDGAKGTAKKSSSAQRGGAKKAGAKGTGAGKSSGAKRGAAGSGTGKGASAKGGARKR